MRNKKSIFFKCKVIGMAILFAFMNLELGSVVAYGKQEEPNPMTGKVIHFFIVNAEEQGISRAEILVSYTRDETFYQHTAYTDSSGNATVTVMNDNDEKTFSYTVNMPGYGSVSGSRDENAWGAPVRINLGGIASFSVIFQYHSSYEDNLLTVQQTIPYGGAATAPDPTRLGYTFTGWSEEFSNVTTDLTIFASYTLNEYPVQYHYLATDGSTIQSSGILHFGESILLYAPNGEATDFATETQTFALSGWYLESDYITAANGILVNENHLPIVTLQIHGK